MRRKQESHSHFTAASQHPYLCIFVVCITRDYSRTYTVNEIHACWWLCDLFLLDSEAGGDKFRDPCSWLFPVLTPPCPGPPKRSSRQPCPSLSSGPRLGPSSEAPLAAHAASPACPAHLANEEADGNEAEATCHSRRDFRPRRLFCWQEGLDSRGPTPSEGQS